MNWLQALKIFNKDHKGTWCIPKKDTPEYKTVVDIMNGKHMRRQEKIQGSGIINDWLKKTTAKADARRQIEWRASHPQDMVLRTPTTVVGSGIVDFFGEAYIKNKAKKEKDAAEKLARTRSLQEHYRVRKAAEKAAAAAPVVTSTPVVGSGFMNDYLRKVSKRLDEREKVEKIKTAERNKTYPTLATGGGRRGRPKGSKNKK